MPIASPTTKTRAWSAIVAGLVTKKKARVMWKKARDVRIVLTDMRAMLVVGGGLESESLPLRGLFENGVGGLEVAGRFAASASEIRVLTRFLMIEQVLIKETVFRRVRWKEQECGQGSLLPFLPCSTPRSIATCTSHALSATSQTGANDKSARLIGRNRHQASLHRANLLPPGPSSIPLQ